jgi:hypothetical protein
MTTKITSANLDNLPNLVDWQAVKTSAFTAESGKGYFVNTTSSAITVTLPSSPSLGDTIAIVDYATTFATNNVTLNPNGNKIEAGTANGTLSTNDQTHTLVYTDSTQGWKIVNQDTTSGIQAAYVAATGGTVATSGDYKIHTFNSSSNFVVSDAGNAQGSNKVSYLIVAGGGGGGGSLSGTNGGAGGGGAGGFREGKSPDGGYTASPSVGPDGITLSVQTYPITVGAGGSGTSGNRGTTGSNSTFSTITSAGGGGGGSRGPDSSSGDGKNGGSGGGGGHGSASSGSAGVGNNPPTSPAQGSNGRAYPAPGGGGGGGAGQAGQPAPSTSPGGNGQPTSITGSAVTYAGGGAGSHGGGAGTGGSGGGGNANASGGTGTAGTANTGGGGGSSGEGGPGTTTGAAGGSGVVIIRYKYQN